MYDVIKKKASPAGSHHNYWYPIDSVDSVNRTIRNYNCYNVVIIFQLQIRYPHSGKPSNQSITMLQNLQNIFFSKICFTFLPRFCDKDFNCLVSEAKGLVFTIRRKLLLFWVVTGLYQLKGNFADNFFPYFLSLKIHVRLNPLKERL